MRTALMSVPEATMHKNYSATFRKNDVRLARQVLPVQAKTKAELVEERANSPLRRCIG